MTSKPKPAPIALNNDAALRAIVLGLPAPAPSEGSD